MTGYEAHRAAVDARDAAGSSFAAVSIHEMALQRYLVAAEHAGHATDVATAGQSSPPPFDVNDSTGGRTGTAEGLSAESPAAASAAKGWRPNLVVAGLDGSEMSPAVVEWAAAEAGRRHAALRLVHAVPVTGYWKVGPVLDDLDTLLGEQGKEMLADVASALRTTDPALELSMVLARGDAVSALRQESEGARLTVIGAHAASRVTGVIFGSVALALASMNPAPVAVIGPGQIAKTTGPVVVGVDWSHTSDAAVAFAFEAAALRHSDLIAVHSWNDTVSNGAFPVQPVWVDPAAIEKQERVLLADRLAGWGEKYPEVKIHQEVVRRRPVPALLDHSRTAQLVVVGSRGRGGFAGMLLGSTSQALITHSGCPVVIVGSDPQH